jgi:hypothetical protein
VNALQLTTDQQRTTFRMRDGHLLLALFCGLQVASASTVGWSVGDATVALITASELQARSVSLSVDLFDDAFRTGSMASDIVVSGGPTLQQVVSGGTLAFANTSLHLTLPAIATLDVSADESVSIRFTANATLSGVAPSNQLTLTLTTVAASSALVVPLGAVTAVYAVLSVAIAAPGLHQLQAAALIGAVKCSPQEIRAMTDGAEFFVAPFPIELSPAGRLGGVIAMTAYVALLHAATVQAIRRGVARISEREVMARTRFPSVPLAAVAMGLPGFVYFSVRFSYDVVDAGITVLISSVIFVGTVAAAAALYFLWSAPTFRERRFKSTAGWATSGWRNRLTTPTGHWSPSHVGQMYDSVLSVVSGDRDKFVLGVFAESVVLAFLTALQPSTAKQCRLQHGAISMWLAVSALLYATLRPYRYMADNVLSALTMLALLVMTLSSALQHRRVLQSFKAALGMCVILCVLRCTFAIWRAASEYRSRASRRAPSVPPQSAVRSDGESSDGGDSDAAVPLHRSQAMQSKPPKPKPQEKFMPTFDDFDDLDEL